MDNQSRPVDVKSYYANIVSVDIVTVAHNLIPDRITEDNKSTLLCDCPHHHSKSRTSLTVSSNRQAFYCFGCGVGGDVLQFVEWVATGRITKGTSGPMPESHRKARDYLANMVGLPPLSSYGMTPDQIARLETERNHVIEVQSALTEIAKFYHERLVNNPSILDWFYSNYAITRETIDSLLIGYADNDGIVESLTSPSLSIHPRTLAYTGAFRPTYNDTLSPFFKNRITFPYWSSGRVVYLIGRKTPQTENIPWESGKYKKLPVHDDHDRNYISRSIRNDHLYNEDILLSAPESIIITEGVTDCITLNQAGFPTISPVTVRFRHEDVERIVSKLRSVKTVYICQDNETSGVGLQGALDTASILSAHKIVTRLIILPRSESETKIDPNSYFLTGGTSESFTQLIDSSVTPLEFAIAGLSETSPPDDLSTVLSDIATRPPIEQVSHLKRIATQTSNSLSTLKDQIKYLKSTGVKNTTSKNKLSNQTTPTDTMISVTPIIPSQPGSCLFTILPSITPSSDGAPPDYSRAAELTYDWLTSHGAQWFYTHDGRPFVFFSNNIYWPDSSERGKKRLWASLIYRHTGITSTTTGGKTFFEVMSNLPMIRGQIRKSEGFSWGYSKISDYCIYLNLNNSSHDVVKITPWNIELITNAGNPDGIILESSDKFEGITYNPDADIETADNLLMELIGRNLACSPSDRMLILSWICTFPLIDFTSTRPMTRFEGSSGSGKTTASKLISTLIFGAPQHKKSTDAANYSDGAISPLVVLDNIEANQMTPDLITFMLTSITGIAKEKRRAGSDTGTITERTKCLLNTTGIEPLRGDLSEIQSRTFVVKFDLDLSPSDHSDCFLESDLIAQIANHRSYILSAIFKKTARILSLIQAGALKRTIILLNNTIPNNDKRRCNDYLALMYLYLIASGNDQEIETNLTTLHPTFRSIIESLNLTSREISTESNQIATCLSALFSTYQNAKNLDQSANYDHGSEDKPTHVIAFTEKYGVTFESSTELNPLSAGRLLMALRRIARDFSLECHFKSPEQLSRRINNDLEIIRSAGFTVDKTKNSHTQRFEYVIRSSESISNNQSDMLREFNI